MIVKFSTFPFSISPSLFTGTEIRTSNYYFLNMFLIITFSHFPSQRLINMQDYDEKLYENMEDFIA